MNIYQIKKNITVNQKKCALAIKIWLSTDKRIIYEYFCKNNFVIYINDTMLFLSFLTINKTSAFWVIFKAYFNWIVDHKWTSNINTMSFVSNDASRMYHYYRFINHKWVSIIRNISFLLISYATAFNESVNLLIGIFCLFAILIWCRCIEHPSAIVKFLMLVFWIIRDLIYLEFCVLGKSQWMPVKI